MNKVIRKYPYLSALVGILSANVGGVFNASLGSWEGFIWLALFNWLAVHFVFTLVRESYQ